ncbi:MULTISPECIES: aromatic-ring-hydroxylating dioxygenase subunit beta [unclassified Mycobacterium]|uniref:aromatic-ring-hydroxylating dioxygenase subunit beta n=1 Tax=unclassified Mycobacterium TaxID=2642494 RepID=UPI0029C627E8|nr:MULTISPECIES: aromatic-ring-hydroxylating dioxygenase subunit beta [unclassified Mycobacterium]
MTIDTDIEVGADRLAEVLRQFEVERFYTDEATLLDAHQYEQWVQLFTDDTHYFMPLRRTRLRRELDKEFTKPGEMAFFDDDKRILLGRVAKLMTGSAWAEDPPSRTRHLVTNVRVVDDRGGELEVHSNFVLYRTRLKSEETTWIGSRRDLLRRHNGSFLIARRHIFLEQTVLLSANLSNFF